MLTAWQWWCRPAAEVAGTGKRKKRKKQKIQDGKGTGSLATGSKTVFDASGRALDSLEVLQGTRQVSSVPSICRLVCSSARLLSMSAPTTYLLPMAE